MQYQPCHVDSAGRPLRQDDEVGPLTWEVLFGAQAVTNSGEAAGLPAEVLKVAAGKAKKAASSRATAIGAAGGPVSA